MRRPMLIVAIVMLSIFLVSGLYTQVSYGQSLAWGSRGDEVREAQSRLSRWGYMEGTIDGVYGQKTYEAVIKFQKHNGLRADGVIGSETRKALGMPTKQSSTSVEASQGVSRSDDINLLARAINAEAKGEPYTGQVAVGAIILNRVKHPAFPNTMAGVIYQPCAFEPVKNGKINETPSESAYKAARDALNGWDPTGGAIYFWNPGTATSNWIWTRKVTLQIGKHVFAHD